MTLVEFIKRSLEQQYEAMERTAEGLTQCEIDWSPNPQAMSIGFLVWHYGRTLDRWIQARALDTVQLWEQGWADRFKRSPADPNDSGYGFTGQQVQEFQSPSASVLLEYALAVKSKAFEFLDSLDDATLDSVTVTNPRGGKISLAMMFQQLIWEFNQHGGQIAYIRGLQKGLEHPGYSGGMLEAQGKDAG